jgi:hypothetical protein
MINQFYEKSIKIIKKASSIADENAENEFDKNRRETLADVSEISNDSSDPKSVQESDENSENDETFPVIIDETLSEKSGNGSIFFSN